MTEKEKSLAVYRSMEAKETLPVLDYVLKISYIRIRLIGHSMLCFM